MDRQLLKKIIPLFVCAVILALAMPRGQRFNYEYRSGIYWPYSTLFAQFDFPILKTDAQIEEEKERLASTFIPYFNYSEEPLRTANAVLEKKTLGAFGTDVRRIVNAIYEKGIVTDEVYLKKKEYPGIDIIYVQKNKRASKQAADEIFSLTNARIHLSEELKARFPLSNTDSLLRANGIEGLLVPNLIFDKETTEIIHNESQNDISSTSGFVNAGQLIVSEGELLTPEICLILDSYKKEYEGQANNGESHSLVIAGNFLISFVIALILGLLIHFISNSIFDDRRYTYLLMIFMIFSLATLILRKIDENLLYLFPFPLAALYLEAFFRPKIAIPVYLVILLPLLVFSYSGAGLYLMFSLSGLVSLYCIKIMKKGWQQFLIALIAAVCNVLVFIAFSLTGIIDGSFYKLLLYVLLSALGIVAGYPLIYLLERIFNFTSTSRLLELCDTSNQLIRTLEQKAPGTFQHSIQVMNMADAVARSIEVNPQLVRAGALYHDIGKTLNPQCFVENESLVTKADDKKYHSGKTPLQSATDIIKHVDDGVRLAEEKRLPNDIIDFIRTHHGTSKVAFFYNKFIEQGGTPDMESSFHYPGVKPKTKEQVILMLCDSIEAASRTLKDYSVETFSNFVEKIVSDKMSEGQLDESAITIHELGQIKSELKTYLMQMHHDRVEYPTNNNKKS